MLRVLHVSPSYARKDGGPSEVLRGLLPALDSLGIEQTVITTDKGANASDSDFLHQHRVVAYRARPPYSWTFSPTMALGIFSGVRAADIVHIHSIHTFTSTLAMFACRWLKTPYLLEPHGALDKYHMDQGRVKKKRYMKFIDRGNIKHLSGIIYSSKRESDHGFLEMPKTPSHVVPLGVHKSLFEIIRQDAANRSFEILFLGRVTEKKHLDLVITALATEPLLSTDCRVTVAGPIDSALTYDPIKLVKDLGVSDRVTFLGQVDANARQDLLSRASVYVLPSEDESFGVAVAESLAAGCPTVASANVGIAPDGAAAGALRFAPMSATALSEMLGDLLCDAKQLQDLGRTGRAYAASNFTWVNSATRFHGVYSEVLAAKPKRN